MFVGRPLVALCMIRVGARLPQAHRASTGGTSTLCDVQTWTVDKESDSITQ